MDPSYIQILRYRSEVSGVVVGSRGIAVPRVYERVRARSSRKRAGDGATRCICAGEDARGDGRDTTRRVSID